MITNYFVVIHYKSKEDTILHFRSTKELIGWLQDHLPPTEEGAEGGCTIFEASCLMDWSQ